ncbi:MAG: TRAP transporter substrate-binding protein [Kiloniellales bacterium]|nr:TRAP transporter substrate-binding protein [Kiloniellales bacterium]
MKLSSFRSLAVGVLAVCAGLAISAEADAKKVRWKMHAAFGKNVAVIGIPPYRVQEWVDKMSGGDFKIKVFEPGALVGGYAYYDAVSQGAIDAAYGTPGANQGKNSAYNFFSTWPFGPGAPEFLAWLHFGGGIELAEEMYARDNIKYHMCGVIPPETSGWFRQPINSLEELKGLKMRFFGLGAKVMQKFGVSTQQLAGGDIYPALELGTIDATEFSMPAIDRSYGFYQIAKHNYFPGWHQQSTTNEILVNMDKWNELSDVHKTMMEVACMAQTTMQVADGEASQFEAMLANEKDGVTNHRWPQEVLDQLKVAWDEVIAEEVATNPDSKRIWDSITSFREKYKTWGEMGYLK